MEVSVAYKFSQIETAINRISEILQAKKTTSSSSNFDSHTNPTTGRIRNTREEFKDNSDRGRLTIHFETSKDRVSSLFWR